MTFEALPAERRLRAQEQYHRIRRLLLGGYTQRDVVHLSGASPDAVGRIAQRVRDEQAAAKANPAAAGGRASGKARRARNAARDAGIIRMLETGHSQREAAQMWGVTTRTVRRIVQRSGCPGAPPRNQARDAGIRQARAAGHSRRDVAVMFGVSESTVKKVAPVTRGAAAAAGGRASGKARRARNAARDADIRGLLQEGHSWTAVAQAFGVSRSTVGNIARRGTYPGPTDQA